MTRPVIITLDIETAPLEVYSWGLWKIDVGLNQIITEWSILAFAVKELGSGEIIYRDNRNEEDPRDDYQLLSDLWAVLDRADIVIAQNGRKFDMKKINARFAMTGFPPPSPIRLIDTVVEARRKFGFTSNKLEWLSKHLTTTKKSAHKKFPGFELWTECLAGNKSAWNEMQRYNIADVEATEELYLKLRPWIDRHPNVAVYESSEDERCPKCGSSDVQHRGSVHTNAGLYRRLRCNECEGWSRSRQNCLPKEERKTLLT